MTLALGGRLEQLRALAAEGHGVALIADRLGVKKQRVIQMAAAHGIKIAAKSRKEPTKVSRPDVHAQTGGQKYDVTAHKAEMAREFGGYQIDTKGRVRWVPGADLDRPPAWDHALARPGAPRGLLCEIPLWSLGEEGAPEPASGPVEPGVQTRRPSWGGNALRSIAPIMKSAERAAAE